MSKALKVIQVCPIEVCDNKPTGPIKVGNQTNNFCCQKGFEKSMEDFNNFLKSTNKGKKL